MRYAILSDIHANLEALTAVLEVLSKEHIDRYLCLGDTVGYGADPSSCLQKLEGLSALTVAGNHDQACIGKFDLDWFHPPARAAILWTREQLGFLELDWLRRLHLTETEGLFTLVHANLRHPQRFEYLVEIGRVVDTLHICSTLFCLTGHTHVPLVVAYDPTQRRVLEIREEAAALERIPFITEQTHTRYLVNPGSVGQPRDGDPRSSVAIMDDEEKTISIRRISYDVQKAQSKIRQAHLPEFFADRLALGR